MPRRLDPFFSDGIYHVYNKTIDRRKIFNNKNLSLLFLETLTYYRSSKAGLSFSKFNNLTFEEREGIRKVLSHRKYFLVKIIAFCLMPTHFHLLLKQIVDGGIVDFIANSINSFTHYFNLKHQRGGPLFLPPFRSRRVATAEELSHVSRYIHLNPYSSGIVNSLADLRSYPWSSYKDYLDPSDSVFVRKEEVLDSFSGGVSYQNFVEDQAGYQKSLEEVKYLAKLKLD